MSFYAGDLSPRDAFELIKNDPSSLLVDVRTSAEWHYVGYPDLRSVGKNVTLLSWRELPEMDVNSSFVNELFRQIPDKEAKICFLCRTGGRSQEAAIFATKNGYSNCYNIAYGFEGELDSKNHRGNINGWKADKLPWRQD